MSKSNHLPEMNGELSATIINTGTMRNKIYYIRGQQVMLDYDLAEIYGYTTSAFNQQVKNNGNKFDSDFMFQLSTEEHLCLKSKFLISNMGRGGDRHLPYAFTEQGVYMLMTILKGRKATEQSKALIRMFKSMKDYIVSSQSTLDYRDNLRLLVQIADNTKTTAMIKTELDKVEKEVDNITHRMKDVVLRSELSPILLDFNKMVETRAFLILNGQPAKADEAYIDIYSKAKKSIVIIDNYINIKSLRLLQNVKSGIDITIFSDNLGNLLHQSDYDDFKNEFPEIRISFKTTGGMIHDRFIVLDNGLKSEKFYHCGASSKDAGYRMTMIQEVYDEFIKDGLRSLMAKLANGDRLRLK